MDPVNHAWNKHWSRPAWILRISHLYAAYSLQTSNLRIRPHKCHGKVADKTLWATWCRTVDLPSQSSDTNRILSKFDKTTAGSASQAMCSLVAAPWYRPHSPWKHTNCPTHRICVDRFARMHRARGFQCRWLRFLLALCSRAYSNARYNRVWWCRKWKAWVWTIASRAVYFRGMPSKCYLYPWTTPAKIFFSDE